MFCGYCGARLKEDSNFCGKCGTKVIKMPEELKWEEEDLSLIHIYLYLSGSSKCCGQKDRSRHQPASFPEKI